MKRGFRMNNEVEDRKGKIAAGRFAILSCIFLVLAGISYIFVPYEQKLIIFSKSYFESFKSSPMAYYGFWSGMFIQAMLMIGLMLNFRKINKKFQSPLFVWISTLGIIGYSLMGLTYISRLYYMPNVTNAYLNSSAGTQETIVALGTMEFDKFIMSYGFASLWFLTVAILSIKNKLFNKIFVVLTLITSAGYAIALIGYFVRTRVLTTCSSCLVIIFPIWAVMLYKFIKQTEEVR